ncbi:hypothetical protein BD779DRAFT_1482845 [Infundibulicybe gibba]|nr:hypothetical protein BD779DRAFT_1482845 [Infundibulicybe gibba]
MTPRAVQCLSASDGEMMVFMLAMRAGVEWGRECRRRRKGRCKHKCTSLSHLQPVARLDETDLWLWNGELYYRAKNVIVAIRSASTTAAPVLAQRERDTFMMPPSEARFSPLKKHCPGPVPDSWTDSRSGTPPITSREGYKSRGGYFDRGKVITRPHPDPYFPRLATSYASKFSRHTITAKPLAKDTKRPFNTLVRGHDL